MISVNKMVNWDKVKCEHPNSWAFINPDRTQKRDGFIEKCYVYLICTFEEKGKYVEKLRNQNKNFDCIKTTFSAPRLGALG